MFRSNPRSSRTVRPGQNSKVYLAAMAVIYFAEALLVQVTTVTWAYAVRAEQEGLHGKLTI